jgi:maleate isomerase
MMTTKTAAADTKIWSTVNYAVDAGIGARAHIGMVVIDNDQTLSYEARAMLTIAGVALYESRISSTDGDQPVSNALMAKMFDEVDGAIRQINTKRPSDVIALGCTSAAMVIGPAELERRVHRVFPHARVTDPFTGIISALGALKSSKVGYVSPYSREVAEKMVKGIEGAGYQVPTIVTFKNPAGVIRDEAPFIAPASISAAVLEAVERADVDTVVVACTQMRAASSIADLERRTGKAVISSNQALCWHALRLAGCRDKVLGWGRLFETNL